MLASYSHALNTTLHPPRDPQERELMCNKQLISNWYAPTIMPQETKTMQRMTRCPWTALAYERETAMQGERDDDHREAHQQGNKDLLRDGQRIGGSRRGLARR